MNTLNSPTIRRRASAWARLMSMAALAVGAWGLSTTAAHARDVHFSVGVHAPGVSVGVSNHPPVVYHRPPVYYAPPPVYYAPPPVYYAPPPVYRGVRPVVVVPPPIYYDDDRGHRKHWKHKHKHDHDWDDRHDRRRYGHY